MKKFLTKSLFTSMMFIGTLGYSYTGPVSNAKVIKEYNIIMSKAKDPMFSEKFSTFTTNLIKNNYLPKTKKDKIELLGFLKFVVHLIHGKIDEYTRLDSYKYDSITDTLVKRQTIHDLKGNSKYKFITNVKDNKELLQRLSLVAKVMIDMNAVTMCKKTKTNPYTYSLLNSGTKVKTIVYYEYPNGEKVKIGEGSFGINTCKDIKKAGSDNKWLGQQPEILKISEYMNEVK